MSKPTANCERRRLLVRGIVQGVGFRPFVYAQAVGLALTGFVLNNSDGVTIEIEGPPAALDAFAHALRHQPPPLAHIERIVSEPLPALGSAAFDIRQSETGSARRTLIAPDTATCPDCLRELFDPADRRAGYPFTNCTNCGPRFTIIQDVPYDRDKTTMRAFPMCAACQREYDNPLDRRFHAQPNACPVCGPQAALLTSDGSPLPVPPTSAIEAAAQQLAAGAVLAVKGLGGYHLACAALHPAAVQQLRQRKQREARPFALMVPNLDAARAYCAVSAAEATLLSSPPRPIVLLARRDDTPAARQLAPAVAPGYTTLGLMLPYTPLHALLLAAFAAAAPEQPAALVMTSGNLSDEPIAYQDDDARTRLRPIASATLSHNRPIHMRCDDSVARVAAGGQQLVRRSRGYVPQPIALRRAVPRPVLACGAHYKNTFCLARETQAFVSHHIGDLENLETLSSFQEGIAHFQRLFDIAPEVIAYDLHPDYLATQHALASPIAHKVGVQHHHAHIASVLAEHGLDEPVIGIAADGTGYGTDGTIWGGEVLVATAHDFTRPLHLAALPLPGGEQAVRQPWRMAAVYLWHTYGDAFLTLPISFVQQLDLARWRVLAQMMQRGLNSPRTSSLGRLFDAVAALVGLRTQAVQYEGQAAIELEIAAQATGSVAPYPYRIQEGSGAAPGTLDVRPLIAAVVDDIERGVPVAQISARFHTGVAHLLADACAWVQARTGLAAVALSGGVFQNRLLLETLVALLEARQFRVYVNRQVPPNDGGISLGQALVAAAHVADAQADAALPLP